jgi:hypothetical protein
LRKPWIIFVFICLFSLSSLVGQQQQAEEKEDPMKNFSMVDKVQPVKDEVKAGFESITGKDGIAYLKFLADDMLEGRDTASAGYDLAALYAASLFEKWGLDPAGDPERPRGGSRFRMMAPSAPAANAKRTYFQNIAFKETLSTDSIAVVDWQKGMKRKSKTFLPDVDYTFSASDTQSTTAPVVFVGYGIQEPSLKLDEYKNLDVKGKYVIMLSETPGKDDPESPFNKGELKKKYYPQRQMMMRRRRGPDPKMDLVQKMGALGVLLVENTPNPSAGIARGTLNRQLPPDDSRPIIPSVRRRMSLLEGGARQMFGRGVSTIRISREMANAILGMAGQKVEDLKEKIEKTLKSQSMELPGITFTVKSEVETKLVNSMNVLGCIEGTDPELKKEAIVIGGHLDHMGRRGDYIYNGADDDGSGSVGVMELAEAFAKNPVKPKRSIVFALWTGEEKGLLGSRYYVMHPFLKIYANINLDMISRSYTKERMMMMGRRMGENVTKEMLEKIDVNKYVSFSFDAKTPVIGEIVRAANNHVGLHINISASESASGGSDHAPFGQAGFPWSFFIAAMTEDYHQPTDSVEKINAGLFEKIMRISYLLAFELAKN